MGCCMVSCVVSEEIPARPPELERGFVWKQVGWSLRNSQTLLQHVFILTFSLSLRPKANQRASLGCPCWLPSAWFFFFRAATAQSSFLRERERESYYATSQEHYSVQCRLGILHLWRERARGESGGCTIRPQYKTRIMCSAVTPGSRHFLSGIVHCSQHFTGWR